VPARRESQGERQGQSAREAGNQSSKKRRKSQFTAGQKQTKAEKPHRAGRAADRGRPIEGSGGCTVTPGGKKRQPPKPRARKAKGSGKSRKPYLEWGAKA